MANEKSPLQGLKSKEKEYGKDTKFVVSSQSFEESLARVSNLFEADECEDVTGIMVDAAEGFSMTFDYEIKHITPAIALNGQPLIYPGEMSTMVALPGAGKSRLGEVLGSGFIAEKQNIPLAYDSWGFTVNCTERKGLIVDTERSLDDCRRAIGRIHKRLGYDPRAVEDSKFKFLDFVCLSEIGSVEGLKTALEGRVSTGEYSFLVIDGILDFCTDGMTDGVDSAALVKWLRALANKYGMAIVTTLHPNKGTETMAGHIGAYLYRWSRACLLLTRHPHDDEVKVITRNFPQGKASHAGQLEDVFYTYDVEAGLHVLCDQPIENKTIYKGATIEDIFRQHTLATGSDTMTTSLLRSAYSARVGISERTSTNHIKMATNDGLLLKSGSTKDAAYALQK